MKKLNKEFKRMQKLAGLINEIKLKEDQNTIDKILDKILKSGMDSLEYNERRYLDTQGEDFLPLTYSIMEYINEQIENIRSESDDEQWEHLKDAEFWDHDFEENILDEFDGNFINISDDVRDYIWEKVNYYDNKRF